MNPSVGRIVHFVHEGNHLAAIIVKVWSVGCVNLHVFPDNLEPMYRTSVTFDEAGSQNYTWHWPERE
jgi:hypothetical protein